MLTLKAQGILVEGSLEELHEELYLTRRAIQYVIDALWELDKLPSINQAHQIFYKMLRKQGFRAHQCKQVYKYALGIVRSAKRNKGRKPALRKLSARLDKYDAVVDLENQVVVIKLRNKTFKIKLLHRRDYIRKFVGRKWYEVIISIDRQGRIRVSIPFRWIYEPYNPKRLISLDINLKKVVVYDGRSVKRIDTRFVEALYLKIHAERVQKKYPRMWRYSKRILNRIRSLHRRSRNIVIDWSRKFAKLQLAIVTKAIEYNIPVIYVNPRGTSTLCPKCGAKLSYTHRLAICGNCGFIADRDTVGTMNVHLRGLRGMWGSLGSPLNAPAMNDETRGSGRTKDEPMTVHIKSYTNI